jgi:hypothetical protein
MTNAELSLATAARFAPMTALTRLASSAVPRADAPTLEASMEMAGKLAASSCRLAGPVAMAGGSALDA